MLKKLSFAILLSVCGLASLQAQDNTFMTETKENPATSVKNQARTGTCWCFSTTSLLESEDIRKGVGDFDLSEMYTVRKMYLEKAKNYLMRQGHAQFGQGGLGHDVLRSIAKYGAMPRSAYTGLVNGQKFFDHTQLFDSLHAYLDTLLVHRPLPDNWKVGYNAILDKYLGKVPETFSYKGKDYTPVKFAQEVMHFNPDDYVGVTSFNDHPFHTSFVVNIPDNYSNGYYYNLPIQDLINMTERAVKEGYTVMWDTDVSNNGWMTKKGYAVELPEGYEEGNFSPDMKEHAYDQEYRQKLFNELITEDDHLMHIVGISQDESGKKFFLVKNSWGSKAGPFDGYMYVSVPYFAINTITLILPKAAVDKELAKKISASAPAFYK